MKKILYCLLFLSFLFIHCSRKKIPISHWEKYCPKSDSIRFFKKRGYTIEDIENKKLTYKKIGSLLGGYDDIKRKKINKNKIFACKVYKQIGCTDVKHISIPLTKYNQKKLVRYTNHLKIEIFICENKGIRRLPKDIGEWGDLKELWIKDNDLVFLPKSIQKLKNLEYIDISGNRNLDIPDFFETVSVLPNLKRIKMAGCNIQEMPRSILKMKSLRILWLHCNPIPFKYESEMFPCEMHDSLPKLKVVLAKSGGGSLFGSVLCTDSMLVYITPILNSCEYETLKDPPWEGKPRWLPLPINWWAWKQKQEIKEEKRRQRIRKRRYPNSF